MGLVPVHTWLPDAHSEAPTPVSALLSGALLTVSFYAILRFYQVTERAIGPAFPRDVLLVFGLASLVLAALYLASQRDLKRLLAYSSIEHMGILAIGMSFSAPIAIVGVLLHVLAHAAAKSTAFFGAGSLIRKFGTKDMDRIRGGIGA
jgi:hydrogenase-4 component F